MISDPFLNKIPPQNLDAEESIISAMMLDNSCLEDVFSIIKPEDFYKKSHQIIFRAMNCLYLDKQPVDLVTIVEKLNKSGEQLEEVGGATYLSQIIDTAPMAVNVIHYSNIVKEKSILRGLIEKSSQITEKCFADNEKAFDILDFATGEMTNISNSTFKNDVIKKPQEVANGFLDMLERNKNGECVGLSTGIEKLDLLLGKLQPSDFVIIAARPSCGKTSIALNNIAMTNSYMGKQVYVVSYETTAEKLAGRMISKISGINSKKFRSEEPLTEQEWKSINSSADQYSKMNIDIDDTGKSNVAGIRRKALKMKKEKGLDIIIIDYLTKMPKPKAERNDLAVGEITGALNSLSNELDIPVVLLAQLNRKLEERSNKRPMLSDLRDSGSIEQDADIILFLYNDSKYNHKDPDPFTEIIAAKARDGEVGMVKATYDGPTTSFMDYNDFPKDWNKKNGT